MIDPKAAYQALISRDARFDGVFYVGVTSTGIYCRPVCPVKPPKAKNCRFFASAEAAEKAAFRPCLRCRPELAPGNAPVDKAHRVAHLMIQRIEEGLAGEGVDLEGIAAQFRLSLRQVRRITQKELGVSPIELLQTRRLLLAKQLLTETDLSVIDIAFASGFASLRRFNDAFSTRYRMPPSRLRREMGLEKTELAANPTSTLRLGYRPPFDWDAFLEFLHGRRILGVEAVTSKAYLRTVRLGDHVGWIRVTHAADERVLKVEFSNSLMPCLPALLGRVRMLFDLSARPDLIVRQLRKDPRLKSSVELNPGLRVPGAFDGFELTWRAILGQQITVKAATTLAGRLAQAFGETLATPHGGLVRLTPSAAVLADADLREIARLGIVSSRAAAVQSAARAFHSGALRLEPGADPESTIAQLVAMPGIGPWTAHYIAMRALRWPDAFPPGDVAVLRNLEGATARQAELLSQAWSPWRSYAVMHLWRKGRTMVKREGAKARS